MKAATCFCVLAIALLQISHQAKSTESEVADLLKDNDNKTVIIRPDTTTSSPAATATTTTTTIVRNLANDTAVNSSPPTQTESTLVETMSPGQQKPPPEDISSQKIKENNTVTSIDNITTTITPTATPNVTQITNSSISSASPSSFINETQKMIANTTTSSNVNDSESKKPEINQTEMEKEAEKTPELSSEQNKISTNVTVTTVESIKTVTEKNESADLAKKNQTKLIIKALNVTESPVTQNTPTVQINLTKESIKSDTETTKEYRHPNAITSTISQEEDVPYPADPTGDNQAEIIPGGTNHSGQAQSLKSLEQDDQPKSGGGYMEPGMTAGIMASIFVGVAIFGYLGLILWRKMLERRYGTREMLVNEDDFNDVNYMSNFEL